MGNYTLPLPLQAIKVGFDTNLPKARWDHISRCGILRVSCKASRCGTNALFLCAQKGPHVRYSMHFSSISFVVFPRECANCFTYFTSFSTAVSLPEQCHHKGLETTVEKHMGSVSALCIIFEKQRTGKISRHLSHYLVKLDRLQSDPDSLLLLPLFCGFPLRPQ